MTTFMLPLSLVLDWVYALNATTCKIIVIIICLRVGVHAECDRSQHSCRFYVLFYSEYIIMLNVPGHAIHGVIIPFFFFFFFFTDLNTLFTGTKISCTSSPVYEGETASVTCHFNSNLRKTKNNFFVYRTFRTDGKRRHGNTLHTNCFSEPVKRYSRFLLCLCILNQSVYLLGMTLGVLAWE